MRRFAIAGLAGGLLAGCMMGPDYVKPKVDTPRAYVYEPKQTAETANTEWWKQFGDPVLDQLIADALAGNKNVKIAAANVQQAAAVLTQTRAPLYPQVNYTGNAGRTGLSDNTAFAPTPSPGATSVPSAFNSYTLFAGASWEIDLWGHVRRLTEAAQANLLATEQARRGVILSLVASVGTSYLQLRGLDAQLEISKRTRDVYAESVKLFELRFQHGQISQMNVEQVRVQYETAAAQIPVIETQIAQLEDVISVLLGRNPGPIPRGKTILTLALPAVPSGLPSQLLERRPDLMQAEQQLIAANAQIGAAKALYFPTISLTGVFGVSSSQLSNLFSGPSQLWNYSGSLVGPIFTGGAISGQVAQATAGQQAALISYELAIQSSFADVENALVARQKLAEQIAAQERLVKALQEYSRLAYLQYNGGYSPYTDVLQAETQLFPAQLNLAAARAQLYASVVRIYQVTGGGWVDIAQKTADTPPAGPQTPGAASATDRVEVTMEGDTSVVNVYHERGIGGAQLRAPSGGWPPVVLVRLHGFPDLESFNADARAGALDCAVNRPQGKPAEYNCRVGGTRVDALTRTPQYFQVKLPATLLASSGTPVELHWVDQWR
ncbi:MAG TPA: efflux transporter outer membrane subunit [Burkholderiales bacterium]|nr:efflux transporter outer membrane subunit [Burkholderiales bacterium]